MYDPLNISRNTEILFIYFLSFDHAIVYIFILCRIGDIFLDKKFLYWRLRFLCILLSLENLVQ